MTRREFALVPVEYVGGPLDGVHEELTPTQAARTLVVGDNDHAPADGWYSGVMNGRRYWHEGEPT